MTGAVGCATGFVSAVEALIVTRRVPELIDNGTVPVSLAYVHFKATDTDCPTPSWFEVPDDGSDVTIVNLLVVEVISPLIQ